MFAVMVHISPFGFVIEAWLTLLFVLAMAVYLAAKVCGFALRGLRRLSNHLAVRRRVRRLVKARPRVEREASAAIVQRRLFTV